MADSKPHQPEDSPQPENVYVYLGGNVLAKLESVSWPVRQQEPAGKPTMTPDQLKEFIFNKKTTITAGLVTVSGLPSSRKKDLLLKLFSEQIHPQSEDLKKVKKVTEQYHAQSEDLKKVEEVTEFSYFELAAIQNKATHTWQWYPFTKRSGYLSCFVSALESDENKVSEKVFSLQRYKQYIFDNDVLDNYFHVLYQLLSSLYNGNPNTTIPVDQLAGGASLFLVNVWDIGLNRAVLRFLMILAGYLHRSFPILTLSLTNDAKRLHEKINTSDRNEFNVSEPLLHLYSRASFLLQFSHLGRSVDADREREKVSQIVAIADTHNKPAEEEYKQLQDTISKTAKEVGVETLLHGSPWIVDPGDPDDLKALKENVDKLIGKEKREESESGIPLSWIFLRSAFFKTGQLYIKKKKIKECAKKCQISDEDFERFLCEFTGFGSIIHIPDIPVLSNYVILNPVDFFHKLTELFYPRFNGDLKYGIASLSTMRRMFGGDLQFFYDILTACNFAVEIDSNRIEHGDTHLPIAEKCLFIPEIRTEELAGNIHPRSLLLVYDRAQPVYITANVVKFLVQEVPSLSLLTCKYYNVTKFRYYPRQSRSDSAASKYTVTVEMIAHADKNEIRVMNNEDNEEGTTDIKKEIIRAYIHAIDNNKERHKKLLKRDAELEFALACSSNPNQHHFLSARGQLCKFCKEDDTFVKMWEFWKELIEEENPTQ